MNEQILCIGGTTRWQSGGRELEESGYVVVHAAEEWEASRLLKPCPINVVSIDSKLMADFGVAEIRADLKDTSPHLPVVLVQTGGAGPNGQQCARAL